MKLRVGYELIYDCPRATPMIPILHIHHTRAPDIIVADQVTTNPSVPITSYRDGYGNWCSRLVAPHGRYELRAPLSCTTTENRNLSALERTSFR
jgi:hypothetical protein